MTTDKDNNPIRYYKVNYSRLVWTGKRIYIKDCIMSEWQLQQSLYDFTSMYRFIVESATYLPDYQETDENEF